MWVLLLDPYHGFIARETRPGERLLALVRAGRLDLELASGVPPETNVLLAIRAQVLVRQSTRRVLARSLQRVVIAASGPRPYRPFGPLATRREDVELARPTITLLVDRLLSPGPLPACGVAKVKDMLTTACNPLHSAADPDALRRRAAEAIDALTGSHA